MNQHIKYLVMPLIAALSIIPFLFLGAYYDELPSRVPVFLDIWGNVRTYANKNIINVFRLPIMAVFLQGISLTMYANTKIDKFSSRLGEVKVVTLLTNAKNIWAYISLIAALKMSLTSMEFLLISISSTTFIIGVRYIIMLLIILAVLILIRNFLYLNKIVRNYGLTEVSSFYGIFKVLLGTSMYNNYCVLGFLVGYIVFAVIPLFL